MPWSSATFYGRCRPRERLSTPGTRRRPPGGCSFWKACGEHRADKPSGFAAAATICCAAYGASDLTITPSTTPPCRRLPLGAGAAPEGLVRLVESSPWGPARLERLRDVEWATRQALSSPLDRLLGVTPRFAVLAG